MKNYIYTLLISGVVILFSSFHFPQNTSYMFIMLRPLTACEGKCNNYELKEFPKKSAEECKREQDSCIAKYGNTPSYYTIAPGEAAIYYKYNKFVAYCDCKIQGVHKSSSVEKAKEEMNAKIAEERVKKPKAFHNYEVTGWWPK